MPLQIWFIGCLHFGYGLFGQGVADPGGDFRQGGQHEIPLVHFHMGNLQIRLVQHQIVIEQNVQIQRSGAPVDFPYPVGPLFDCATISMAIEFLSLDLGCGDFILTNSIAFFYSLGLTSIVTLQSGKMQHFFHP